MKTKFIPYFAYVGILMSALFICRYVNFPDSNGKESLARGDRESSLFPHHYPNERNRKSQAENSSRSYSVLREIKDLLGKSVLNSEEMAKLDSILNTIEIDDYPSLVDRIFDSKIPYWEKPEFVGVILRRVSKERPDDLADLLGKLPEGGASEEAIAKLFPFLDPFDMQKCNVLIDSLTYPRWRSRAKDAVLNGYENRLESGDLVFDQALANEINALKFEEGETSLLKRRNELVATYANSKQRVE